MQVLTLLLIALLHHSFGAEYDVNQPITLTGTLTAVEGTNPHTHFYLDVKDDKGKVVNWKFEGYNPSVLVRNGWKKDVTMKVGALITGFGWGAGDGGSGPLAREITVPDGKNIFFGPPAGTGD